MDFLPSLGQLEPYRDYLIMAVNGLIAGWLASILLGGGGLIRAMLVGIIGAFVGGALVKHGLLTLPAALTQFTDQVPYGTQILVSTIGAMIVVLAARFLGGRS